MESANRCTDPVLELHGCEYNQQIDVLVASRITVFMLVRKTFLVIPQDIGGGDRQTSARRPPTLHRGGDRQTSARRPPALHRGGAGRLRQGDHPPDIGEGADKAWRGDLCCAQHTSSETVSVWRLNVGTWLAPSVWCLILPWCLVLPRWSRFSGRGCRRCARTSMCESYATPGRVDGVAGERTH